MAKEVRNIYPGECLFLNDTQVLRVQTFGASSTLNSEDVNELGNFEIVEIVDNVPAVAITLDTYCYGSIETAALIADKDPLQTRYVRAADFEKASVDIYAPIIKGEDYGATGADNPDIYRTMYIDNAFVNSLTLTYNTTAIATENYALESDNKAWYFNEGASVVHGRADIASATTAYSVEAAGDFTLDSGLALSAETVMTQLNDGTFTLATDLEQKKIIKVVDANDGFTVLKELVYAGSIANGDVAGNEPAAGYFKVELAASALPNAGTYPGINIILAAADATTYDGEKLDVRYVAQKGGAYFTPDTSQIAGLRLGQVQIYLAPNVAGTTTIDMAADAIYWRMISATVTVTLTREALLELGHFRPYSRPLTFPIPVTVAVESTDADTELFARLCGKDFDNDTEVSIDDLLKDRNLVIKLYRYNDIEKRKIAAALQNEHGAAAIAGYDESDGSFNEENSTLIAYGGSGTDYATTINNKTYYTHDLAPLKVVVVKKLIPTGENQNLAVGGNATQTFDFRADNATLGIGAGNGLCQGYDGQNQGEASEITAGSNGWQALKWGGTNADI